MPRTRKKEWFDEESYWRAMYPYMFGVERMTAAPDEMRRAIQLAKPKGKDVLDLCCGPGRCSIALAKRGYRVTGVDRTKYLLDMAKTNGRAAKVKIEWIRKDMRDFVRPASFDLVLNMFTSFGFFDKKEEDLDVLRNMFTNLRPGGACLIDLMGKEQIAKSFTRTTTENFPDGTKLIRYRELIDNWTRMRLEWILIRRGRAKSFPFYMTLYSAQELIDRLEKVGFGDVKIYGNLDGAPYDLKAQRMIAVARKPK
jgi:SAM-dependent methyltransferase